MFGHQDDQSGQQDSNLISDQSIEGAINSEPSPQTVQPTAEPVVPSAPPSNDVTTDDTSTAPTVASPSAAPAIAAAEPVDANSLIDIKQQALTQLSPLIGHLEQTPEEKFRTTMMMIQASDDQDLIRSAFEAAQNITEEKVRAQALLDIVNEINYFTQGHEADQPQEPQA